MNLHQSAQHATTENQLHYERHRPEETVLYQLVQENVETFFAQVETENGTGLPDFVKDEFEAFLAHGFLRLRCADCTHEKLVAFSCKRRGFCASCGGGCKRADGSSTWSTILLKKLAERLGCNYDGIKEVGYDYYFRTKGVASGRILFNLDILMLFLRSLR